MRVLVADDDPVTLRLLTRLLQKLGHEVTVAPDGLAARRMFRLHRFPAVITDWEMPGLSGIDLCRQIRSANLPAYTFILMLSARRQKGDLIEGLAAGADDFASKPIDPDEITVRLRAAERILTLESQLVEANRGLAAMNQRLQRTSRLDPLMEIGNRMAFEEEIGAFHQKAVRRSQQYGVVMCDVDHFKEYNDQFGHPSGDQVLRKVAATVRASVRSEDAAFRYGGDEILILLSQQDLQRTAAAAERIRKRVEQLEFVSPRDDRNQRVTVSCGVAAYPEHFVPELGWKGLVECADVALYQAKTAGRSQVAAYDARTGGKGDIVDRRDNAAEPVGKEDGSSLTP